MKRVMTFLVAVVSCWAVSFAQAANVEMHFYSGVSSENAPVIEDLHFAVVELGGDTVVKGNLSAVNNGVADVSIEANNFYVVAEQPSTKFFGSALVEQEVASDDLYFVLDETGLTWLKDAHWCSDEECHVNNEDIEERCWEDDDRCGGDPDEICDENCVCRRLNQYALDKANIAGQPSSYGQSVGGSSVGTNAGSVSTTSSNFATTSSNLGSVPGVAGSPYSVGYGMAGAPTAYGVGQGSNWAAVAMAVALGVAIPVSVSAASRNNRRPVSPGGFYYE